MVVLRTLSPPFVKSIRMEAVYTRIIIEGCDIPIILVDGYEMKFEFGQGEYFVVVSKRS